MFFINYTNVRVLKILMKVKKIIYLFVLVLSISGCEQSIIDSENNLTREETKNAILFNNKNSVNVSLPRMTTTPNISKLLVAPPPPPMGNGELISFATTEEVPIKDVLVELGRLAGVDIEVDPNITGGIILKVTNKPLNVIVQRIADLGNLRYSYSNNILRFERDTPYTKTYNVDFLIENEVWNTVETSLNTLITLGNNKLSTNNQESTVDPETGATVEGSAVAPIDEPKVIINKPASTITVYANQKTQDAVARYIENVKTNYAAQVLIEAKIVEVDLNDQYKTGIDWSFVNDSGTSTGNLQFGYGNEGGVGTAPGGIQGSITTAVFGGNLTAAINALDQFGLTKTLSSPRVHAINNQKAELKFISKLIYFNIEKEEEERYENDLTTTSYTSTKQEEEVGVVLTITPSINLAKNEITLNVVPELKVQVGEVEDPVEPKNIVPVIQSRSVQTTLKIKSGNVLVIGGLMSEEHANTDTGVPFLSGIPIIGNLFRSTERNKQLTETVIFIKATIVKPNGEVSDYDKTIYDFLGNKDNYMWE